MIPMPTSYSSLSRFYAADELRHGSSEVDLGLRWRSSGATFRAAWVQATGEVYLFEHIRPGGGGGTVHVLGRRFDAGSLLAAFCGWRDVCGRPESLSWLLERSAFTAPSRMAA
jgi:hypothetical protein